MEENTAYVLAFSKESSLQINMFEPTDPSDSKKSLVIGDESWLYNQVLSESLHPPKETKKTKPKTKTSNTSKPGVTFPEAFPRSLPWEVIERNYYPVEQARRSNFRHRPVGLGVLVGSWGSGRRFGGATFPEGSKVSELEGLYEFFWKLAKQG